MDVEKKPEKAKQSIRRSDETVNIEFWKSRSDAVASDDTKYLSGRKDVSKRLSNF